MRIFVILILLLTVVKCKAQVTTYSNPSVRGCAAFGTDTSSVRKYIDYCKINNLEVYFPEGTYQLPENWEYSWGSGILAIRGDGIGKTTLTCSAKPLIYTKRIDLSQPKNGLPDGYYIADVVPTTPHSDWSALTGMAVGGYFKIVSGTPSTTTQATAAAAGYVVELDNTEGATIPTTNGLYVVAKVDYSWGGGFSHDTLEANGTIRVTLGSVVKRTAGVWSRYNPGSGFKFSGDFLCKNITFKNIPFFVFSPIGTVGNKSFRLQNCSFSHCTRVNGLESSGGDSGALLAGWTNKPGGGTDGVFRGFAWDYYEISGCKFDNILTSINWFTAFAKNWRILNNDISDCFTMIEAFEHQLNEINYPVSNVIFGNTFHNCRNYSGAYAVDKILIKTKQNASVSGNDFQLCNGIQVYVQGSSNIVSYNTFNVYNEYFGTNTGATVLVKGGNLAKADNVSNNSFYGGGTTSFVVHQKNSPLKVCENTFIHAIPPSSRTIESTTTTIDKSLGYIVNDTTQFKVLAGAGGYSTTGIVPGDDVYYDYSEAKWKEPSYAGVYACVNWSPTENLTEGIFMENNYGSSNYYFYSGTASYTMNQVSISDVVYFNTLIEGIEDITNIYLKITSSGAPALNASPGSTYQRTDGGASTSLYIKETAKTSTTWEAK